MAKITLPNITSGYYSTTALNDAFTAIETAIENTVSRDGTAPNNMSGNLDMNSNRILNLPAPGDVLEPARLQDVLDAGTLTVSTASLVSATATTNNASLTVQGQLNNLGESTGAASVGNTPAGNISATTVQAAINELDSEKQPLDATLTALAGTLTAANKIPYATALDTAGELDFKDEDNMVSDSATAVPSQQSTKAYVDTSISNLALTSGSWTPTVTPGAGVTSATATLGLYLKVGNIVYVSGMLNVVLSATTAALTLSLPINKTGGSTAGGGTTVSKAAPRTQGTFYGDILGQILQFNLIADATGTIDIAYSGAYIL